MTRRRLEKYARHQMVKNIVTLYGVHFAKYLLPLATIPYLTRVLGPNDWGVLAIAQAYATYIGLLAGYGFDMSGAREIARYRNEVDRQKDLFAGVIGAQALLAICAIAITFAIQQFIPIFQENTLLLWSGMFWSLCQAIIPLWYFVGTEKLRLIGLMDISLRVIYSLGVFIFVRSPDDTWKVLGVQGVGAFISMVVMLTLVYREISFRFPTSSLIQQALKTGWTMFLFLSVDSLYKTASTFILGLFVSPQVVGYYAGAEKINRTFTTLFTPIFQSLYPRLSNLTRNFPEKAARLGIIGLVTMGTLGLIMGIASFIASPWLVRIFLGTQFRQSIQILQILSLLMPLTALSMFLGMQWMLPLGLDNIFNKISFSTGFISIITALLLTPYFAEIGMAWIVVATQFCAVVAMYTILYRLKLDPFTYSKTMKTNSEMEKKSML